MKQLPFHAILLAFSISIGLTLNSCSTSHKSYKSNEVKNLLDSDTVLINDLILEALELAKSSKFERALPKLDSAENLVLKANHIDSIALSTILHRQGNCYHNLAQNQKAKSLYEEALEIRTKIYPKDHTNIADSYYSIGNALFQLGDIPTAIYNYEIALDIYERESPRDSLNLSSSYFSLGNIANNQGEYGMARDYMLKAYSYCIFDNPEYYNLIIVIKAVLGGIESELGDFQKAKKSF